MEEKEAVRTTETTVDKTEEVNLVTAIVGRQTTPVSHTVLPTNISGCTEAAIINPANAREKLQTTRAQRPLQIAWEGQVFSVPLHEDGIRN